MPASMIVLSARVPPSRGRESLELGLFLSSQPSSQLVGHSPFSRYLRQLLLSQLLPKWKGCAFLHPGEPQS